MTMRELPAELRSLFDDREIAEVECAKVRLSEKTSVDVFDLVQSWASKVRKIDLDRALPRSDRTVWNEHDLAGTLFWRDFVAGGLDQLRPDLRAKLQPYLDQVDDRFRSITVEDPELRMVTIAGVEPFGRAWWWYRIPGTGPIAEVLAGYSAAERGRS
jgi:hypothetical protein